MWQYKFVEHISTTPVVRLDLHSDGLLVTEGVSFGNAPLRRATSSTMLRDGDHIAASAYGNRTLTLPVHITAASPSVFQAKIAALYRELSRDRNTLLVQTADRPVFFRTYRASDAVLSRLSAAHGETDLTIELQADPFAYGTKETLPTIGLSENVPLHWVSSTLILGDAPAPLMLSYDADVGEERTLWLASRTGPLSTLPLVDTTDADADWTYTPSPVTVADLDDFGGSRERFTLTNQGDYAVANFTVPLRPGQLRTALAGTYRVFAFVNDDGGSFGTDSWKVDVRTQFQSYYFGVGHVPLGTPYVGGAGRVAIDLGLVQFPFASNALAAGFDEPLDLADLKLSLFITRLHATGVGSDDLALNAVWLLPADESLLCWQITTPTGDYRRYTLDPESGSILTQDVTTGQLISDQAKVAYVGGVPYATPGQDLHLTGFTGLGVGSIQGYSATGVESVSTTLTASYWPRYLSVA